MVNKVDQFYSPITVIILTSEYFLEVESSFLRHRKREPPAEARLSLYMMAIRDYVPIITAAARRNSLVVVVASSFRRSSSPPRQHHIDPVGIVTHTNVYMYLP